MTHLQPHSRDSRGQELRSSPFWHSLLFWSQLVKDGDELLLQKGIPKDTPGFWTVSKQALSWSPQ